MHDACPTSILGNGDCHNRRSSKKVLAKAWVTKDDIGLSGVNEASVLISSSGAMCTAVEWPPLIIERA
jgi:hypothetical protein